MAFTIFTFDYLLAEMWVVNELNKSKPKVLSARMIWIFFASVYVLGDLRAHFDLAFRACTEWLCRIVSVHHGVLAYLNAMVDSCVFDNLRVWLSDQS